MFGKAITDSKGSAPPPLPLMRLPPPPPPLPLMRPAVMSPAALKPPPPPPITTIPALGFASPTCTVMLLLWLTSCCCRAGCAVRGRVGPDGILLNAVPCGRYVWHAQNRHGVSTGRGSAAPCSLPACLSQPLFPCMCFTTLPSALLSPLVSLCLSHLCLRI